ncbi:unnamed protein product [Paramecium octaurelia]|uniref:Uncharacterized protein n=1 Tax=Paramecium octaurelia TaxID=43137 RepID=A0A8S1W2R8_PAROT|nr:unnamed protein product [Paramecium octaurelia]
MRLNELTLIILIKKHHSVKENNYIVNQVHCEILQEYLGKPKTQTLISQVANGSESTIFVTSLQRIFKPSKNQRMLSYLFEISYHKNDYVNLVINLLKINKSQKKVPEVKVYINE